MNVHTPLPFPGIPHEAPPLPPRRKPFGSSGFIRGANIPLPTAPPAKNGRTRRIRKVDSFAGGGGATEGIEEAMRRLEAAGLLPAGHGTSIDIAINHDDAALAMHAANHPDTLHLPHNVWKVSLRDQLEDDYFGLLWMSPDCRDHSNAKGGPITSRSVRDLAWVVVRWLKELPDWQRPWCIFLENVPAFVKWGPLIPLEGGGYARDKTREGEIFERFVRRLAAFGYSVGWKEIVACEFGDPTIRKRLKLVARRDGGKINWPAPTHGAPDSDAVRSGKLLPWPVAADIIDFSIDCPSIFYSKEEAKEYTRRTGKRIIRPLAAKTGKRIAQGVGRYVIDDPEPFIVTCNHHGEHFRGQSLKEPFVTVTRGRDAHGLVVPHVMAMRNSGKPYTSAKEPVHTVVADGAGLTNVEALIAPVMSYGQHGGLSRKATEPHSTIAASPKDQNQVIEAEVEPISAQFQIQHDTGRIGHHAEEPVSTIRTRGTNQGVVAAHMLSLKGSERRLGSCLDPHPAACASGQHSAVVQMPLIAAYYSEGGQHGDMRYPMLAATTKDRFALVDVEGVLFPIDEGQLVRARRVAEFLREHGVWNGGEIVTITIAGELYVIVDIGMRMLTVRELARAQGFRDSYILAVPYKGGVLSETEQRHKIGNSVCKLPAAAVVEANYRPPLEWGEMRSAA